ncbi:MAG: ABC transporter ATP-binding protein [Anaerolineae bacterium]|nr:ABC transporter ATP-binding protein [Anaerolineae bacterium]
MGSDLTPSDRKPVLEVRDLRVHYDTPQGRVRAVDGVGFALQRRERFGLVGESGSGKSTIALALLQLIKPPGRITSGEIRLDGTDLCSLTAEQLREFRLAEIALIGQGAMNSLNPVMRVREQILDGLEAHDARLSGQQGEVRVRELLARVGLAPTVAGMYPHELSGGMKQRVCIAIAISLRPKVIIADEPTSALDVVVQRHVIETLRRVQEELGAAVLLIGHDMGLMAQFVDRLGVMYAGRLVEEGPVRHIFGRPRHPYSQLLMGSLPSFEKKGSFSVAPGSVPSLLHPPPGCAFHPRCFHACAHGTTQAPEPRSVGPGHWAACHLVEEPREAGP